MTGESQCIEYKESWNDDYLKWICGFANAQGGILYIGIDDKGKVAGLKNAKKLMEDIPNKVRDIPGIIVDVNLHIKDGKEYIEIVVNKYPYGVNYKGEYLPANWTVDNLFEPHNSIPFNPYIAKTFYRTGMIETWGRGIEKIVNGCVEEKVPLPKYAAFPGDINIIFSFTPEYVRWSETVDIRTRPGTVAGPGSGPNLDSLTEVQIKILTEISQKSDITQRELASNTGLARSTIINNIATLKNYGILIRIGSSQKGYWQIVDSFVDTDTNDQETTKKTGEDND